MAIDFPASPSTNDTHSHNGLTWKYDGTTWVLQATTNNNTFTGLTDTPATYTANKFIKVNSGATALEFTDAPQRFTTFTTKTNAYNLQASDIGNVIKMSSPSSGTNLQLGIPDLSSSLSYGDEVRIQNGTADYITVTTAATTVYWGGGVNSSSSTAVGQEAFITTGSYSWTCPLGVSVVSAVVVGGGGGGGNVRSTSTPGGLGFGFYAGSGGALGWKNNIPVTPGQTYAVVVGDGGSRQESSLGGDGTPGTHSYFINTATLKAEGGGIGGFTGGKATYVGDGGGDGGLGNGYGSGCAGGGGAGGYTGDGGNGGTGSGGSVSATSGIGGGAAGGTGSSVSGGAGGGGGVGILGQGSNGSAIVGNAEGGPGGSGGSNGEGGFPDAGSPMVTGQAGAGGGYGGGGGMGSSGYNNAGRGGHGAAGAVRIIWGAGRAYPSTLTADQTPVSGSTSSTGNRQISGYSLITLTYIGNNTWNIHGDGVF
mgnify:CR=1 FL=1